ncbi:hypothetical protein B0T18DRAFT_395376 [Schizothecium vesticola]|uniref:Uncharacterized protein n=1 Tax=Schizothecium vesticola TaxID=314040 RepID=A0AA40F7T3_9PEZI|nr:hypothetical protein B0T18DRAFT_395376 [Schizothecium vesticola]
MAMQKRHIHARPPIDSVQQFQLAKNTPSEPTLASHSGDGAVVLQSSPAMPPYLQASAVSRPPPPA